VRSCPCRLILIDRVVDAQSVRGWLPFIPDFDDSDIEYELDQFKFRDFEAAIAAEYEIECYLHDRANRFLAPREDSWLVDWSDSSFMWWLQDLHNWSLGIAAWIM
jgi:hypothetical protein